VEGAWDKRVQAPTPTAAASHCLDVSSLSDPLAPAGVTLTNTRRPLGLSAFWDKAAGDVDQFHLQLYSKSHAAQRNISVGPNTRNFTFLGLSPGIQYFLKVTVLAGPYRSSSHFATEWTCEWEVSTASCRDRASWHCLQDW